MPTYDCQCLICKKRFSLAMTYAEHEKKRIKCPKCGKARVTQLFSSFMPVTSKKT